MKMLNNMHFSNFYSQNSAANNLPSIKTSSLECSKSDWIKNKVFTDNQRVYYQDIIIDDKK